MRSFLAACLAAIIIAAVAAFIFDGFLQEPAAEAFSGPATRL